MNASMAPVWSKPQAFCLERLGPGLDPDVLRPLCELSEQPETRALVVFGSRGRGDAHEASDLDLLLIRRGALNPAARQAVWKQARQIIGPLPVDLDLLVEDEHSAQEMAGSRWHVLGRIAQEGRVIYAS